MSRRKDIEGLAKVLGENNVSPLVVHRIALMMHEIDNEFKVAEFKVQANIKRPKDADHGSGISPFNKAFVPALQEFVRFWTTDMQKEFNVMDFAVWRAMMEEFEIAIESLQEKDDAFSSEVEETQRKYKEEVLEKERKREEKLKARRGY